MNIKRLVCIGFIFKGVMTLGVLGLTITLLFETVLAQEPKWVTAQGSARIVNGDRDQAHKLAMERAMQSAYAAGLEGIPLDRILADFRLSGNTFRAIPHLAVAAVEQLEQGISDQPQGGDKTRADTYYTMKIRVALNSVHFDSRSTFRISAVLNQSSFLDGEEMQLRIHSNESCRFAVYIIDSEMTLSRLVPSLLKQENRLAAGSTIVFPNEIERGRGIHLRAHVAKEGVRTDETVFILATRDTDLPLEDDIQEAIFGLKNGRIVHLDTFIKKMVAIPLTQRSEYFICYAVRPRT